MRRLAAFGLGAFIGCHDWSTLSSSYGVDACVAFVVAGDTHTCARKTDGSLFCWGDNRFGQLGTSDTMRRSVPTQIESAGAGVAKVYLPSGEGDISADRAVFTCALKTDSSLSCWGDNHNGQLGTGDVGSHLSPVPVQALGTSVARATAGAGHTCAQTTDGTVWCWGNNQQGQLGTGSTQSESAPAHLDATGLGTGVDAVSAGGSHTCAHKTDGTLWCWGNNQSGQLGIGTNDLQTTPAQVTMLGTRTVRVSTGGHHTCAATVDGAVYCWGDNRFGQLGTGDTTARNVPTQVDPTKIGSGVSLVYAGGNHTCIPKIDGSLWCWGANRDGQLGTGDTTSQTSPVQVTALGTDVASAYAGGAHTCALKTDGAVWCWGNNQYGQLGVGAGPLSALPAQVFAACR